ncbi:MAG: methylmalonyl-CoA carboxyltransferase, partial [Actinomycetota bacterium]|nr:methylmalonyl-CoA carboxyltransferase [Actinomycetota bacterium]
MANQPVSDGAAHAVTTADKLAEFDRRQESAQQPVGAAAVERHRAKGKLTARERIELLLD